MQPTVKDVHKDTYLTGISVGYDNPAYISDYVFPNVTVQKQSDYYYKFLKGAWFRNEAEIRGPGARAARGGYPVTSATYMCQERAFAHPVPIELINNADPPVRPFETGTRFVTSKVKLAKEIAVAELCMTAGSWTTSNDANAGWAATTDGSGNTFIGDMEDQIEVIRKLIGRKPNRLVIDAKTFRHIRNEYTVLERMNKISSAVSPAVVTAETIAAMFSLDQVIVGSAIKSTAEEVVAGTDFTAVDIWETNATKGAALLFYGAPSPEIDSPSAGYTFNWKGSESPVDAELAADVYRSVRYWWDKDTKSYIIEASENFDCEIVCPDAGCLFYDTIVT